MFVNDAKVHNINCHCTYPAVQIQDAKIHPYPEVKGVDGLVSLALFIFIQRLKQEAFRSTINALLQKEWSVIIQIQTSRRAQCCDQASVKYKIEQVIFSDSTFRNVKCT